MKKTLKTNKWILAASAVLTLTVQGMAGTAVGAESLANEWRQRQVHEVKASLDQADAENRSYIVQWGDTLSTIAEALEVDVETLTIINEIQDPDHIVAGAVIRLSNHGETLTYAENRLNEVSYSVETGEAIERETYAEAVEGWADVAVVNPEPATEADVADNAIIEDTPIATEASPVAEVAESEAVEAAVLPEAEPVASPVAEAPASDAAPELAVTEDVTSQELVSEPVAEEEVTEAPVAAEANEATEATEATEAPAEPAEAPEEVEEVTEEATDAAPASQADLSAAEAEAKEWIAMKESGGDYNAVNPTGKYIGRYQLTNSYLNGDHSPENQERVADAYVQSRYGSWVAAKEFWLANGWY